MATALRAHEKEFFFSKKINKEIKETYFDAAAVIVRPMDNILSLVMNLMKMRESNLYLLFVEKYKFQGIFSTTFQNIGFSNVKCCQQLN